MKQKSKVLWFTGLPGAGKSTIAIQLEQKLRASANTPCLLDGDIIRLGLNQDLGFTQQDRVENIRRIAEVAKLMAGTGLIVIVAFISPFRSGRAMARNIMGDGEFAEIFIDTPIDVCEKRDPKGLYAKARRGELPDFTGIDSPYEAPERPEVHIETLKLSADEAADAIVRFIRAEEA